MAEKSKTRRCCTSAISSARPSVLNEDEPCFALHLTCFEDILAVGSLSFQALSCFSVSSCCLSQFRVSVLPGKGTLQKGASFMSTEEQKAIARRLIEEAWNQGNLAAVDELLAHDHVPHHSLIGDHPPSRELYKQFITRTRAAFPDLHATIEDQIAEGDKVVTRWSVQGTHHGSFRGHS